MAYISLTRNLPLLPARRRRPAASLAQVAVLAEARAAQADVQAAEARKLAAAVAWARLHQVDDPDLAATWAQCPLTLGGEGVPLIAQGCVAEFGTVIGTSTNGARAYLADALEIAYRFPNLYARTQDHSLPVWKARRIAAQTTTLPAEAAGELDLLITPVAGKLSAAATERTIAEAIAKVIPEYPQQVADQSSNHHVVIDHRQVSFQGTSQIYAAVDLADALDFEAAVARDAETQKAAGSDAPLGIRRALAVGRLARGEATGRAVTLYVHLPTDSATNPTALVENGGQHLLTQAQVATWTGNPDVKVSIKPVIDLHDRITSTRYVVPDKIREHTELRDRICVFPHCDRLARGCQKDHINPHSNGGATDTANLANLCQHHHNLKTHGGWTYTMIEPRTYLWRSPHGHTYLRDHHGTQDLTPRPVEPPADSA